MFIWLPFTKLRPAARFLLVVLLAGSLQAQSPDPSSPPESVRVEGIIVPGEQVQLAIRVGGVISKIKVKEGDRVTKDQPLLEIDPRSQAIESKVYALTAAKARSDAASLHKLYQEKIVSRDEYEKAEVSAKLAEANFELSNIRLDFHILRATKDGLIHRLQKKEGEAVQTLETLVTLVTTDPVSLLVYLDARYLTRVTPGSKVLVQPVGETGDPLTGRVELVDRIIEPGTGVFRVKISLENPTGHLVPGLRATAIFDGI